MVFPLRNPPKIVSLTSFCSILSDMFDTTHPDKYLSTVTLGHLVSAETGIYQLAELGRRAGGRLDILAKSKTNKQKKQALKVTLPPLRNGWHF